MSEQATYATRGDRLVRAAMALGAVLLVTAASCDGSSDPAPSPGGTTATSNQGEPGLDSPGYGEKAPLDPVAVNGPIFTNWSAPTLALVITGRQQGYLEPCGCAGLENQKGGLSRRHTMIQELAERGWPLLAVDVGGQIRRFGRQAEIKFQTTAEALKTMNYEAIGFGPDDLRLPTEELVAAVADAEGNESPFVSANVALFGFDAELTPRYRVVEREGYRVGITAVLGDRHAESIQKDDIEILTAAEALEAVLPALREEADFLVLLAYANAAEAAELAEQFPEFGIIVCAEGTDEPPSQPQVVADDSWLVDVGSKGMYAAVVGLFTSGAETARYQRVPLDARFEDSPAMHELMVAYQGQLRELGWEGLGLHPSTHPRGLRGSDELEGQFASVETCKNCHRKAYEVWEKSGHAHATASLVKLDPERQFDPECVSCHVTGWNPQEYFPYETGYESMELTPHLAGNSCENCHGPGAAHVAAETARGADRNLARRDQLRQEMRLTKASAEEHVCARCHDADNSPDFNFERYWPKVEHRGKD